MRRSGLTIAALLVVLSASSTSFGQTAADATAARTACMNEISSAESEYASAVIAGGNAAYLRGAGFMVTSNQAALPGTVPILPPWQNGDTQFANGNYHLAILAYRQSLKRAENARKLVANSLSVP